MAILIIPSDDRPNGGECRLGRRSPSGTPFMIHRRTSRAGPEASLRRTSNLHDFRSKGGVHIVVPGVGAPVASTIKRCHSWRVHRGEVLGIVDVPRFGASS